MSPVVLPLQGVGVDGSHINSGRSSNVCRCSVCISWAVSDGNCRDCTSRCGPVGERARDLGSNVKALSGIIADSESGVLGAFNEIDFMGICMRGSEGFFPRSQFAIHSAREFKGCRRADLIDLSEDAIEKTFE